MDYPHTTACSLCNPKGLITLFSRDHTMGLGGFLPLLTATALSLVGCGGSGQGSTTTSTSPSTSGTSADIQAQSSAKACAAAKPGPAARGFPTDTASYGIVDGLYQRPEGTTIAAAGANDGVSNGYSDPFNGSLGGRYLLFWNGSFVTVSGQGYLRVRWEMAWFNTGGVFTAANSPLITTTDGTVLKKVALANRFMPDLYIDAIPGQSSTWFPGLHTTAPYIPVTTNGEVGTPSMWINEYYYLDGQATFKNRESGLDYNISVTPVSWQNMHDDVAATIVVGGKNNVRAGISLDPYVGPTTRPTSPAELAATVVSDGRADLTWTDCSDNERGFMIEYSYEGDFGNTGHTLHYNAGDLYTTGGSVGAGSRSFSLVKLKPETRYFIRVKAYNELGDSEYSDPVEITTPAAQPLQTPWAGVDIGSPAVSGRASQTKTSFTLRVGSGDLANYADSFHFVYQTMTGNGTITARVVGQAFVDQYAKAAVMVRESLDTGSRHMSTMSGLTQAVRSMYRDRTDNIVRLSSAVAGSMNQPYWVRVTRNGNTLTSSASPDGVTWTDITQQTLSMPTTVYVGLAMSTRLGVDGQAVFDNVSVTHP